jgi:hypothetical protein
MVVLAAKWPGRCQACATIKVGQQIDWRGKGDAVHLDC